MIKNIVKEAIIVLLLVLAILLILGVFLYDYIPMNKVVPKIEQYETSNKIKQEIEENIDESENTMTPIIYEINNSDLKQYEKTKDYQKGKVNPFADTNGGNKVNQNTTTTNDNNTTNNTNTDSNSNHSSTNSSEGNYLPNTGTK